MKGVLSMPSSTVEDYLKHLYLQQQQIDKSDLVAMGQLATVMGVAPGTATAMIKTLADSNLVDYEPRNGVRLSNNGQRLALNVLRRHRLLELFLVKVVGLDWSEVHAEAEQLEHAISDKLLEKIDRLLDHPSVDPHGDPIPTVKGKLISARLVSLAHCKQDRPARVTRVLDQDPHFLKFVDRAGLMPGTRVTIQENNSGADAVTVLPDAYPAITIGNTAAEKILVEVV